MPSPFPGMDPWLESPAIFPDLHTGFIAAARAQLNAVLPPPFYAGVSTRVWMEDSKRNVEPDVDVLKPTNGHPLPTPIGDGGIATLTGQTTELLEITADLPDEEMTEAYIDIFASPGEEMLISSIEMLSPSNKARGTTGRALYLAKQQELRHAGVHLVEIDLLRRGTHTTMVPLGLLRKRAPVFDYHLCLNRGGHWSSYFVVPLLLSDRLPVIPIWLTDEVPPVTLDLQAVMNRCYDEARYNRRARYLDPANPPLTDDQRKWAEQILREKNLLPAT